jgi:hypothetical protein
MAFNAHIELPPAMTPDDLATGLDSSRSLSRARRRAQDNRRYEYAEAL